MLRPILYIGLLAGCGPLVGDGTGTDGAQESSGTETAPLDPSTTGASGSPPSVTSPSPTTVDPSTTESTTDATFGGATSGSSEVSGYGDFIIRPDGGWCGLAPEGTKFHCSLCDVWSQDCPDGEKCTPWANDGGNAWNTTRCSPIDPDAGSPGDPCTMELSPASGLDTCEVSSMCWDVDETSLVGVCVGFCEGSENNPICAPDTDCMIANDGVLTLCIATCDPLASTCADGSSCHPIDDAWFCIPDDAPISNGQLTPALCDAGTTAVDPERLSSCDPEAELCCTPICDVAAPNCADPLQCVAVIEGTNAGVCVDEAP